MSNETYGFIELSSQNADSELFARLEKDTNIGIARIPESELYNFPADIINSGSQFIPFIVGDRPGKSNTTYLTDFRNYDADYSMALPRFGRERINLLIQFLLTLIDRSAAARLVVAITEGSQIEDRKMLKKQELGETLMADFERCDAPPDCLYDVLAQ